MPRRQWTDREILAAIVGERKRLGYPPTVRDLQRALGAPVGSGGLSYRLGRMEAQGLVRKDPGIARSIRITQAGRDLLKGGAP